MKKKILVGTLVFAATIGAIGLSPIIASAQSTENHNGFGGYGVSGAGSAGLENKSKALDMTSEQLQEQLKTKSLSDLIAEKDMTLDQYHDKIRSVAEARWKSMGLSDEEIQERAARQTERQANCDGSGQDEHRYGMHGAQNQ